MVAGLPNALYSYLVVFGRLKEVTDAHGNKTEYVYDKADRLIYICQHGQAGEFPVCRLVYRYMLSPVLPCRSFLSFCPVRHSRNAPRRLMRHGCIRPVQRRLFHTLSCGPQKSSVTAAGIQSASQTTMEGQCAMSGAAWDSALPVHAGRYKSGGLLCHRHILSYCQGHPLLLSACRLVCKHILSHSRQTGKHPVRRRKKRTDGIHPVTAACESKGLAG